MKKTNKEKKDIQKIVNKIVKKPQNALLALVNSLLVCKDESMFKDILLNQREYIKKATSHFIWPHCVVCRAIS